MRDFLADSERLIQPFDALVAQWNAEDHAWGKFQLDNPISLNGDEHRRVSDLVSPAFVPAEADRHRPLMQELFTQLIRSVADKGQRDFARLAAEYPVTVMSKLLRVPLQDVANIEIWLGTLLEAANQQIETLPRLDAAVAGLLDYTRPTIDTRRNAEREDDLLQLLLDIAGDENRLSDRKLHHFMIGLLSGGYATTMHQLILTMINLCHFPVEWEKLAADESRCKAFVDESLRYKSMFGGTARATAKEFDYRGVTFPANTMITIPLTFAGQDPKFNDNPTSFSPDRKTCKHIAFGDGAHICPGRFLATAMIEEALPIVVKHFPRPRIVGELEYIGPFGAWSVRALPIEWNRERLWLNKQT